MDELRIILEDGRRVSLPRWTVTVGRAPENDLVLEGLQLSRRHAEIRFDGRDWLLVDLGSTGGTSVNRHPLGPYQPYRLRPGNLVSMGGRPVFRVE